MKILKSLTVMLLSLTLLNACTSADLRQPAAATTPVTADEVNYNSSSTCTQVEADIEKWIAKAGPVNSDSLAQAIVTKAADRCATIIKDAGKSAQLNTKKQDCAAIQKRSIASTTDQLIYSQCLLSAGVETEKGL